MFIEFANTLSILNIQEIAIYWTMKGTSRVNMTTKQFALFYSFTKFFLMWKYGGGALIQGQWYMQILSLLASTFIGMCTYYLQPLTVHRYVRVCVWERDRDKQFCIQNCYLFRYMSRTWVCRELIAAWICTSVLDHLATTAFIWLGREDGRGIWRTF